MPWLPLVALSAAIFVAVTSEFLPIGMLPQMAAELGVSEAQVGMLVTVFAASVVVATAPLIVVTRDVPRKTLLLIVLVVFAGSNALAALAPDYAVLVISRVVSGAAHGVFWAVVSPYAARLVPPERLASGVAIATSGATFATILGVPLGAFLGATVGWRSSFAVIAVLVVVIIAVISVVLPAVEHRELPGARERRGRAVSRAVRDDSFGPVILLCLTVVIVTLGHTTFYAYIASWILQVAGFPPAGVAGVLLLFGVAGALGVLGAGLLGDRYPRALLPVLITGVIVSAISITLFSATPWAVLILIATWGAFLGGVPVLFQSHLLRTASPALRDIGSAWLTVAFNVGIAGGAFLGGLVIEEWSLSALPIVTAAHLLLALLLVAGSAFRTRADVSAASHRRARAAPR
jgi:MFS transporter, DHA1 family, inner membrane transport protein